METVGGKTYITGIISPNAKSDIYPIVYTVRYGMMTSTGFSRIEVVGETGEVDFIHGHGSLLNYNKSLGQDKRLKRSMYANF